MDSMYHSDPAMTTQAQVGACVEVSWTPKDDQDTSFEDSPNKVSTGQDLGDDAFEVLT